jgi:hypothetical protein
MISIIYTFNKNSIKSENLIHIYDFGSYKGFLKNDNFSVYKILHKEMKDTLLYEECEMVELTPFQAFSIEKYEYIEKDEVVYTSNFSIQFKQVLNSSDDQLSSQPLVETLFDQSLLIQIHQNSKKKEQIQASLELETLQLPEQQTLQQPLVRQTSLKLLHNQGRSMIPLGQVLKMQIPSLNQSPRR